MARTKKTMTQTETVGIKVKVPRSVKRLEKLQGRVDKINAKREQTASINAAKKRLSDLKYQQKQDKMNFHLDQAKNRYNVRKTKQQADFLSKGPKGYFARRHAKKVAKAEADIEAIKNEPNLSAKERIERLKSETSIRQTKAKGAAYATVATALGTSYANAKKGENEARMKEAEAEKSVAEALRSSLNSVKDVDSNDSHTTNITGMISGVR